MRGIPQLLGQVIALAVADEEIRGQGLRLFGNFVEIHAFPDDGRLGEQIPGDLGDGFFETAAGAAGGAEHRRNADLGQEGNEPHHQVFFPIHHGLFAKDVLVAVHHGVDEAAPLQVVPGRRGSSGQFFQHLEKTGPFP